jgi:predicted amidohydrolase
MHCVVGVNERGEGVRHNSAVLLGPQGHIATYRKLHLFNNEKSWFEPGGELPVVDLPFGRVGMVICFDLWFPEAVRALALAGAEVVAVPTNWVGSFKRRLYDDAGYCQGDIVAMASAAQNGLVMACADRVGVEREVRFLGCSVIVGTDGWPVAGPAGPEEEVLLVADVDLDTVASARGRTPRNNLLGDRRPDSYNAVVVRPPRPSGAAITPIPS